MTTCEMYDIEKNSWHMITPMPQGRRGCSAVSLNGLCIIVGGAGNTVAAYDPAADRWLAEDVRTLKV